MPFTSGIALALALALTGTTTAATVSQPMPQAQTVQEYVENYFAGEPVVARIAGCESHFTQYDAGGSVYRGKVDNQDVGVMQINERWQGATAQKLGLDLYTIEGNVAYAQYLYEKAGTTPWDSSKVCWSKYAPASATVVADAAN